MYMFTILQSVVKVLARRLQDDSSWSGPGVVVCIERDQEIPRRVWVRIRTRVKVYPLEKLRLATPDEMVSAEFITAALKDVEKELESETLKVEAPPQLKQFAGQGGGETKGGGPDSRRDTHSALLHVIHFSSRV